MRIMQVEAPHIIPILINNFAGRRVRITHQGGILSDSIVNDICKTFHDRGSGAVDVEMVSGNRYGFVPDTLVGNAVEGDMISFPARRRIEIVGDRRVIPHCSPLSEFSYPLSLVDDRKLRALCDQFSSDPALFLKVVASAFVRSILEGNENPQEKARRLRLEMCIKNGNVTSGFHTSHPLIGNEFKDLVYKALRHFGDTGQFPLSQEMNG